MNVNFESELEIYFIITRTNFNFWGRRGSYGPDGAKYMDIRKVLFAIKIRYNLINISSDNACLIVSIHLVKSIIFTSLSQTLISTNTKVQHTVFRTPFECS